MSTHTASPADVAAADFNNAHSVGTRVLAYPGSRDGRGFVTRTRTPAWVVGNTAVVSVDQYAGGIALTHIDVAPLTWSCMVCGSVRADARISVAHRPLPGLEDDFPATRVNVRHCNDLQYCTAVAGARGPWSGPPPESTPVTPDPHLVALVNLRATVRDEVLRPDDQVVLGFDPAPPGQDGPDCIVVCRVRDGHMWTLLLADQGATS